MEMKKVVCCRCKNERDESEFSFKNKSKNIRNKTCKICFKDIRKQWYTKYKQQIINKNILNKNKNITWFENYKKDKKCSICGESHPACLDFHHLDPNIKEFNIGIIVRSTYSIKKIIKEINKCIILCSNCHRKLHYNERNVPIV